LIKLRFILIFGILLILVGCSSKKDIYLGMSPDQIFAQGQKNMAKEDYADAVKDFEALEARDPYGPYSHEAQLSLMTAYYKKNDSALALAAADRFIRMNPRDPKVDYAYYLKGLVNFDLNTTFLYRHLPLDRSARDPSSAQDSFDAFHDLIDRFPNSEYIPDARQRMIYLRNQLAQHELGVIDYYMKRGAYLSAANRANYIVKNFERTPSVPRALRGMVIAYRKLGMNQLADEAYRTLELNYPDCEDLRGL
jgi:outer membrane protein assembly factor BamD